MRQIIIYVLYITIEVPALSKKGSNEYQETMHTVSCSLTIPLFIPIAKI